MYSKSITFYIQETFLVVLNHSEYMYMWKFDFSGHTTNRFFLSYSVEPKSFSYVLDFKKMSYIMAN